MKQFELDQGIDRGNIKIPGHLEIQAPTFEKEDLKKLIAVRLLKIKGSLCSEKVSCKCFMCAVSSCHFCFLCLFQATTKDLEKADRMRRDDFKKYEMEKKFEQHERLNHIEDEEKRKEEEKIIKEAEEKHKKHAKPHHPMTKDQLEEVWEEQDHMRAEDWDPKTFFAMHDLNGDNHWDEDEVRVRDTSLRH